MSPAHPVTLWRCLGWGGWLAARRAAAATGLVPGARAIPQPLPSGSAKVGVAAVEELGVGGLFGYGGAGRSRPAGEFVQVTRAVHGDDDRAADTGADRPGLRVGVACQLAELEQRQHRAAELNDREAVRLEHHWPAKTLAEVALPGEILHSRGNRVGQRRVRPRDHLSSPGMLCAGHKRRASPASMIARATGHPGRPPSRSVHPPGVAMSCPAARRGGQQPAARVPRRPCSSRPFPRSGARRRNRRLISATARQR